MTKEEVEQFKIFIRQTVKEEIALVIAEFKQTKAEEKSAEKIMRGATNVKL